MMCLFHTLFKSQQGIILRQRIEAVEVKENLRKQF